MRRERVRVLSGVDGKLCVSCQETVKGTCGGRGGDACGRREGRRVQHLVC